MGVRILESDSDDGGNNGYAVLYCSTSMWAFGPVFEDRDEAKAFLEWYGYGTRQAPDLRLLTDIQLKDFVSRFRNEREEWETAKNDAETFDLP